MNWEEAKAVRGRLREALDCLRDIVKEESKEWSFDKWYADGIDCYLAREVLYLMYSIFMEHLKDLGDEDLFEWEPYYDILRDADARQTAEVAWEYAQSMDDFTRLWNDMDWKLSVVKEFLEELEAKCQTEKVKSQEPA